jgi:O-antigen/teichoic acid export membrane protein
MVTVLSPDTMRRTARAAAALAASEVIGKVASLASFMICAQVLGLEEFGVFSLGLGIGLLLAVLPSMGLDARLVQLASPQPERLDALLGALIRIRILVCAGVVPPLALVLWLTIPGAGHLAAVTMLVLASLLDTFSDAFRAACGSRQRQHRTAVVLVVQRLLGLVLLVVLLTLTAQVWAAALAYLLSILVGLVGMADSARRVGANPRLRDAARETRALLAAARVTGLEAVATMGLFRIDTVLVGILLGNAAVGAYSAAYRLLEAVLFVSWTLSRAYVPVIASQGRDRDEVRRWTQHCSAVVFALYLPYGVLLALAGDDLVGLLFGEEFVTPWVMLSLAAAPLMFGLGHLGASVLLAMSPDPVVLRAAVVALVVNVGANLVLIPWWGIIGAGVATTGAFVVQTLISMRSLRAKVGEVFEPRRIGVVVLASAVAGVVMSVTAPALVAAAAGGAAYVAAWALISRLVDRSAVTGLRMFLTTGPAPRSST